VPALSLALPSALHHPTSPLDGSSAKASGTNRLMPVMPMIAMNIDEIMKLKTVEADRFTDAIISPVSQIYLSFKALAA
jgi:hypothetical protein